MPVLIGNFGLTRIVTAPSPGTSGLSFVVTAGQGTLFPSPTGGNYFYGVFSNPAQTVFETVKITARSTDTFTIASGGRGQDGSTPQTWNVGDFFYYPMTNLMLQDWRKEINLDAWSSGDVKLTLKSSADTGWVLCNDGTIGSASSGASTRVNDDTSALFQLLWNNISNTYAPVSGGRGASAAADFAAHKTIALTKMLGRSLAIAGTGAGLTTRALGQNLGAENIILAEANLPSHSHGVSDPGHNHTLNNPSHTHTINDAGHNHTLNNPAHNHDITDPGHSHSGAQVATSFEDNNDSQSQWNNRATSAQTGGTGTGITINNASTAVSANSATTGVTAASTATAVTANSTTTGITTTATGSGTAKDVMNPTSYLNAMIKL
jgi:microcystin-dependent protein